MKKITHIITTISRGGAENQLLILAREQIRSGWHVSVIYLKDSPELIEDFKNIGVEVIVDCARYSIIRQIWWLRRYFMTRQNLIHAHLPRAEILTSLAALKKTFVVSRHNAEAFFPSAPTYLSSLLSRFVTRRAKSVIAISKAVEIFIRSKNEISKDCKVYVIHYGFDSLFTLNNSANLNRTKVGLNKNDFVFGTIGRIVPQKDYPTLLKAFGIVAKEKKNFKLLIVGDGYLEGPMKNLAFALGISSQVVWLGRSNQIVETLKLLDCFVLCSSYEGFGLVLLEAMSTKIPIIASRVSAIPEVLGLDHPLLSTPGDASDFANKMNIVSSFSNEELTKLIDFETKQLDNFNPKIMAESLEKAYFLN